LEAKPPSAGLDRAVILPKPYFGTALRNGNLEGEHKSERGFSS